MAFVLHMRQVVTGIGLAILAAGLVLGVVVGGDALFASVFDGDGLIDGLTQAEAEIQGTGIREETDIVIAIGEVINFILMFAAVLAFIAFVVAGFMFILGFGSDASIQRAKKIMIWSIVGLIVIVFAFVIVQFIIEAATAGSASSTGP